MENNIALQDRRLPAGIQSFEEIRREKYLYVDKTDIHDRLKEYYDGYHFSEDKFVTGADEPW